MDTNSQAGVRPADGYAGDIPPQLAFEWMTSGDAVLVDVRTDAEREWVGHVPGAAALAWKQGVRLRLALRPTTFWRALRAMRMRRAIAATQVAGGGPDCRGDRVDTALTGVNFLQHETVKTNQ